MQQSRVVITGIGVVSPLGCTVKHVWDRLCEGACGIVQLNSPEYAKIPARVAGLVPRVSTDSINNNNSSSNPGEQQNSFPPHALFENYAQLTKAELHRMSKASSYALAAANEAVLDADISNSIANSSQQERAGVAIGVGMIDLDDVNSTYTKLQQNYSRVDPFFVSRILPNSPAGIVSIRHQLRGPNLAPSTACATGLHAITEAYMLIKHQHADVMVCGGAEACISPLSVAAFARMRALATRYNDAPTEASRPFDADRDGFVIAEGSAVLVLESLHHALRRRRSHRSNNTNAPKIYAEILGFGLTADAHHMTAPPEGATGALRAMQLAANSAGVSVHQIGHVNAHATSTPQGDAAELQAIHQFFALQHHHASQENDEEENDNKTPPLLVTSTKGATGHLLGAAGAIEALFTAMSCYTGTIPPTLNCNEVDIPLLSSPSNSSSSSSSSSSRRRAVHVVQSKACTWPVSNDHTDRRIAITNSFGFGGTNASLCLAEFIE